MEPLAAYFARYNNFVYDPSAPATSEFNRLCNAQGWPKRSDKRKDERSAFKQALIEQFNTSYGTDINDLNGWHALMSHLNIDPLPDNAAQCKKVVKGLFVNLVDLVDARGDPTKQVELFESNGALSHYTKSSGKVFPRDEAKAGGILKFLLRQIMGPGGRRE